MKRHKKPMTIVIVLVVVIVAMAYVGCKAFCPQPLDKGMERTEEDGHNKEAILDGPNGTSTNAFTGKYDEGTFPVEFSGADPTIVNFMEAIIAQEDIGEVLSSVNRYWEQHCQGKPLEEGLSFLVDRRNGYIRFDSKDDDENVIYTEFCYWNYSDGKHKLVCVNTELICNGQETDCQSCGLFAYIYDNEQRMLTYTQPSEVGVDQLRNDDGEAYLTAYRLPRRGRDIQATVYRENGQEELRYKWNGQAFEQELKK